MQSVGPGDEKDKVESKFNDLVKRWEELKRHTNERHAQLEDLLPLAQKYHDNSQNVKDVVILAEAELGSLLNLSQDIKILKQELQNIKVGKQRGSIVIIYKN